MVVQVPKAVARALEAIGDVSAVKTWKDLRTKITRPNIQRIKYKMEAAMLSARGKKLYRALPKDTKAQWIRHYLMDCQCLQRSQRSMRNREVKGMKKDAGVKINAELKRAEYAQIGEHMELKFQEPAAKRPKKDPTPKVESPEQVALGKALKIESCGYPAEMMKFMIEKVDTEMMKFNGMIE